MLRRPFVLRRRPRRHFLVPFWRGPSPSAKETSARMRVIDARGRREARGCANTPRTQRLRPQRRVRGVLCIPRQAECLASRRFTTALLELRDLNPFDGRYRDREFGRLLQRARPPWRFRCVCDKAGRGLCVRSGDLAVTPENASGKDLAVRSRSRSLRVTAATQGEEPFPSPRRGRLRKAPRVETGR